jgi:hypothetical protein
MGSPRRRDAVLRGKHKKICFITKSVKKGDVFKTLDEDGDPEEALGDLVEQSIPDVNEDEVFSSLRFNLFFLPTKSGS